MNQAHQYFLTLPIRNIQCSADFLFFAFIVAQNFSIILWKIKNIDIYIFYKIKQIIWVEKYPIQGIFGVVYND
jgi:hypothetical protein